MEGVNNMEKQKVQVVQEYNQHDYQHTINIYTSQGYKLITANIEGNRYTAVLVKD